MLNYGADATIKDREGNTVFHLIAQQNYLIKYLPLLKNTGLDVNTRNNHNLSMLHIAIKNEIDPRIVDYFKDLGGNLNLTTYVNACNYIEYALDNEYMDIIPNLIINGAKLNLISAVMLKMHNEAIRFLNKDKQLVKINKIRGLNHNTPLHYASKDCNLELVMILIKKGIDINAVNKDNKTPLDMAEENQDKILNNNNALIAYLKTYGAVRGKDKPEMTKSNIANSTNIIDFQKYLPRE